VQNALLVADDLTGAVDTGHGFAARGRGVRVRLRGEHGAETAPTDRDVLAVDTDSRAASPSVAAEAVTRAVAAYPAARVYKKVDSTLRGNVVAEVDAAVAATDADLAVVAPAFPATGRTTEGGRHLVDGTPLAEAGYGVAESDLRTVFARSRYLVESLDLATVERGPEAVRETLASVTETGEPVLAVCDATTEDHLDAIATGGEALVGDGGAEESGSGKGEDQSDTETADPLSVLFVGSGGLARHVAVPGNPAPATVRPVSRPGTLAVVGSTNERTLVQLAAVPDDLIVALDPAAAVRNPEEAGQRGAVRLGRLLDRRGRAVVTAATGTADVETAERVAAETETSASDSVETALASAASGAVAASQPGSLVLTGGAVARAVLTRLEAPELAITGEAVADGVPESAVATGPARGTRVVTKAGGFGDERTILNCLDAM
jgi:uncharacterized protein YgbK (DUF1537 family)